MFQNHSSADTFLFVTKLAKNAPAKKPGITPNPGSCESEKGVLEFLASFAPNEKPTAELLRMKRKEMLKPQPITNRYSLCAQAWIAFAILRISAQAIAAKRYASL